MSLTSILKAKEHRALKDKLKLDFPKPDFLIRGELLAPPLTKDYGLVGQAFDYLMRFYLKFNFKDKSVERPWVANHGLRIAEREINWPLRDKKFLQRLYDRYNDAGSHYEKFISNGVLTDELITSALFLARLDTLYRCGSASLLALLDTLDRCSMSNPLSDGMFKPFVLTFEINEFLFGNENRDNIHDLRQLMNLLKKTDFVVNRSCFLNPTFGATSLWIGGADADLIIDGSITEIKTIKEMQLRRTDLNQLICYYILSLIGGINDRRHDVSIDRIGIYFSRFGKLWQIPLAEIADQAAFIDFKKWFIDYIEDSCCVIDSIRPVSVSSALEAIVGPGPMPRIEAMERVKDYIKFNDLQADMLTFNTNEKLAAIFGKSGLVGKSELRRLLDKHLTDLTPNPWRAVWKD